MPKLSRIDNYNKIMEYAIAEVKTKMGKHNNEFKIRKIKAHSKTAIEIHFTIFYSALGPSEHEWRTWASHLLSIMKDDLVAIENNIADFYWYQNNNWTFEQTCNVICALENLYD